MFLGPHMPRNRKNFMLSVQNDLGEAGEKLVRNFNLPKYYFDQRESNTDKADKQMKPRYSIRHTPNGLKRAVDIFLPIVLEEKAVPNNLDDNENDNTTANTSEEQHDNIYKESEEVQEQLESIYQESEEGKERAMIALQKAREINMSFSRGFMDESSSSDDDDELNFMQPFGFSRPFITQLNEIKPHSE